jgi:hypothetical protein
MLSLEQHILICAACDHAGSDHRSLLEALLRRIDASGRLIDTAVKEGLAGLLYKCLHKLGLLRALDPAACHRLESIYYQTVSLNVTLLHEVKAVVAALQEDGVPAVLLQGVSLLAQVYQDSGLRPMKDVDAWVLPKHFAQLHMTLSRLGFQRHRLYPKTFTRGTTVVDVHTHVFWADRIKARDGLLKVPQEDIFQKAQKVKLDEADIRCLSCQDQVIYLSLHAIKHNYERLIWLVDVLKCLNGWNIDQWRALWNRSEELGQRHTLSFTLYVLDRLFKFRTPHHCFQALPPNAMEKHILKRRLAGRALSDLGQMVLLSRGKPLATSVALVLETIFPRPEVLRQVFADQPDVRACRLYVRRVGQVIKAVAERCA